jgi:hypothetical protein
VTVSLTVHGALVAAALVGLWKLGGESKFGTEKVADLQDLRPRLLKKLVTDLDRQIKPVLVKPIATEWTDLDENGHPRSNAAQFSVAGLEALKDTVREFVKSDSPGLLDLREAHHLESRLNRSLNCLRKAVWGVFAASGAVCLLMVLGKFEWLGLKAAWIHGVALAVAVSLLLLIAFHYLRILNAAGSVDRLKSSYADLS